MVQLGFGFTVTDAEQVDEPPAPLTVIVYVVFVPGVIVFVPDKDTDPIPLIEADVAFELDHESVTDEPAYMLVGLTDIEHVGAGVGGV